MKILSIRQPWAYLITRGSKSIENRSWPTNYRGPVLIHASLKIDKQPCVDHRLDPTKLETGGVVGIAEIVDCVTTHRSKMVRGALRLRTEKSPRSSVCEMDGRFGLEGRTKTAVGQNWTN